MKDLVDIHALSAYDHHGRPRAEVLSKSGATPLDDRDA